jgi:hypothetical protein
MAIVMSSAGHRSVLAVACVAVYALVCVCMCRYIVRHSNADFDTLMYTACVHAIETGSADSISARTYAGAALALPPEIFKRLTDPANSYRRAILGTPAYLEKQLPFYRLKAGYVLLLSLAHKSGVPVYTAMRGLNVACYLLLALLLLIVLKRAAGLLRASVLSTAIMLCPSVTATAMSLTPDMLAALLLFSLVYCLSSEARVPSWLPVVLSLLLIYSRPENIIFVMLFSAAVAYTDRRRLRFCVSLAAASAVMYLVMTLTLKPYPWAVLYHHSFRGFMQDPAAQFPGLDITGYLEGLRYLPHSILYSGIFMTVFLLLFYVLFQAKARTVDFLIAVTLLASMGVRAFLFPDISERYFTGYFLSAVFLVVMGAARSMSPHQRPAHE